MIHPVSVDSGNFYHQPHSLIRPLIFCGTEFHCAELGDHASRHFSEQPGFFSGTTWCRWQGVQLCACESKLLKISTALMKLRRKKARKYYLFGAEEGGSLFSSPLLGCCYSSVTPSCLTLCDPMDCSTPGLPVLQHLPDLTQTHDHRVGDTIESSHPLSSHFAPAFNLSQHQGLF